MSSKLVKRGAMSPVEVMWEWDGPEREMARTRRPKETGEDAFAGDVEGGPMPGITSVQIHFSVVLGRCCLTAHLLCWTNPDSRSIQAVCMPVHICVTDCRHLCV